MNTDCTVPEDDKAPEPKRVNGGAQGAVDKDLVTSPEFSDDSIALKFAAKHHEDLRYVDAWGKWLHWDGTCWQRDKVLRTFNQARTICRAESVSATIRGIRPPRQSPAPGQSRPSSGWRVATSDSQRRPTNGMQTRGCSTPQAASLTCGPAIYGPPGAKTTAPRSPQSPPVASARCGSSSSTASLPATPISSPLCSGCAAMP